jgi:hypothetical protein
MVDVFKQKNQKEIYVSYFRLSRPYELKKMKQIPLMPKDITYTKGDVTIVMTKNYSKKMDIQGHFSTKRNQ